jgi:hypothetical protein
VKIPVPDEFVVPECLNKDQATLKVGYVQLTIEKIPPELIQQKKAVLETLFRDVYNTIR